MKQIAQGLCQVCVCVYVCVALFIFAYMHCPNAVSHVSLSLNPSLKLHTLLTPQDS